MGGEFPQRFLRRSMDKMNQKFIIYAPASPPSQYRASAKWLNGIESRNQITCKSKSKLAAFSQAQAQAHVVLVLPPPRAIGFPRGYPQKRLGQLQAPLLCIAYNRQYKYTIQFQGEHSKNLGHSKEPCTHITQNRTDIAGRGFVFSDRRRRN